MKKICIITAIVITLLSLTTCKKDKAPTPPEIKIHNIEPTANTVHVDGAYIYEGEAKLRVLRPWMMKNLKSQMCRR